jgi:hypothetical protein
MKNETRLKLYRALGLIKAAPKMVSFTPSNPPPIKVLLLFPLQVDHLHQSQYVVERLREIMDSGNVFFAIAENYREIIECSPQYAFYFPVNHSNPIKMRMDVMLARYRGQQFDAVINLDPVFNLQMARIISAIKTTRRVGFAGPLADVLYNIQIQTVDQSNLVRSYAQMLELCDLKVQDQAADEQLSLI